MLCMCAGMYVMYVGYVMYACADECVYDMLRTMLYVCDVWYVCYVRYVCVVCMQSPLCIYVVYVCNWCMCVWMDVLYAMCDMYVMRVRVVCYVRYAC